MFYEWDETKRAANVAKHGLDFLDADLVLENDLVRVVDSPRKGEDRRQAFAYVFGVLTVLTVAFVPLPGRYRILSFRPAHLSERKAYYAWLESDFDG